MTEPLSAVNAQQRVITDYGVDPNNPSRGLLHELRMRLSGFLVPAVVGGDADPETQFHGYGPPLQDFTGMANMASGTAIRNGGYAEVSDAQTAGPMGDPARRIFADRLRRRGSL